MSNTYTSFPLSEMTSVLREDRGWTVANGSGDLAPSTKEYVLDWEIPGTDLKIRVFTSVAVSSGWTRKVGSDAIRVCVPRRLKSVRVYRTEGWQDRLKARVGEVLAKVRNSEKAKVPTPSGPRPMHLPHVRVLLTAAAAHLKYPSVRFQDDARGLKLKVALAGPQSKYAGQVMVTDGGAYGENTYFGRIDQGGTFFATAKCGEMERIFLAALNEDPAGLAAEYGRKTGRCCFCAKELTTAESTHVGYGPVCAGHYNLPWGHTEGGSCACA